MCHLRGDCIETVIDFLRATRKLIERARGVDEGCGRARPGGPPGPEHRRLGGLLVPHGGARCRGGDDGRRASR